MIPYLLLALAVCALLGLGHHLSGRDKGSRRFGFFDAAAVLLLCIFAGARVGIGTDYASYERAWSANINPGSWDTSVLESSQDMGFAALQYFAKSSGWSFTEFIFVVSTVSVCLAVGSLWSLSPKPRLTTALYLFSGVYLAPFNTVRQGLAVSIVLLVFALLRKGKWLGLLILPVAMAMHSSAAVGAAVLVVLALVARPRPRAASPAAWLITVSFVGIAALSGSLLGFASLLNPRYATYVGADEAGWGTISEIAVRALLVIWALAVTRRAEDRNAIFLHSTAVAVGAVFLAVGLTSLAVARLDYYFWPLASVLVAEALSTAHKKSLGPLLLAVVVPLYYAAYLASFGGLLPYSSLIPKLLGLW